MSSEIRKDIERRPCPHTDQDLLARYRETRDPDAFCELIRRHRGLLRKAIRQVLSCEADAEDALQETLLALATKLPQHDGVRAVGSWLWRIARNQAIDWLRGQPREYQLDEHAAEAAGLLFDQRSPAPDEAAMRREAIEELTRRFAMLPAGERRCIRAVIIEGKSYPDTADILGIPLGTVKSRISKGLTRLQTMYDLIVDNSGESRRGRRRIVRTKTPRETT